MQQHDRADLGCLAHGDQEAVDVAVESLERQEYLDTWMAHGRELSDLLDTCLVGIKQHRMLEVVRQAVGVGIGQIAFHALDHLLPLAGERHVADRCHTAGEGGLRSNFEVVGPAMFAGPGVRR